MVSSPDFWFPRPEISSDWEFPKQGVPRLEGPKTSWSPEGGGAHWRIPRFGGSQTGCSTLGDPDLGAPDLGVPRFGGPLTRETPDQECPLTRRSPDLWLP